MVCFQGILKFQAGPENLTAANVNAEAVYTYIETTGKFECSNELFNNINKIWWRSQTDNMHGGIASDCPNRERSPYTGDGQVACVTVMHNFRCKSFLYKMDTGYSWCTECDNRICS